MGRTHVKFSIVNKFKFLSENKPPFKGILHGLGQPFSMRPLHATWSHEAQVDFNLQGIDAERELVTMMSELIANDIDSDILRRIRNFRDIDDLTEGLVYAPFLPMLCENKTSNFKFLRR